MSLWFNGAGLSRAVYSAYVPLWPLIVMIVLVVGAIAAAFR